MKYILALLLVLKNMHLIFDTLQQKGFSFLFIAKEKGITIIKLQIQFLRHGIGTKNWLLPGNVSLCQVLQKKFFQLKTGQFIQVYIPKGYVSARVKFSFKGAVQCIHGKDIITLHDYI